MICKKCHKKFKGNVTYCSYECKALSDIDFVVGLKEDVEDNYMDEHFSWDLDKNNKWYKK